MFAYFSEPLNSLPTPQGVNASCSWACAGDLSLPGITPSIGVHLPPGSQMSQVHVIDSKITSNPTLAVDTAHLIALLLPGYSQITEMTDPLGDFK